MRRSSGATALAVGIALAVTLACALPVAAAAQPPAITRAEYARVVERMQADVAGARDGIAASLAARALGGRLRGELASVGQVTEGGRTYDANTSATLALVGRLEGASPGARLAALSDLAAHLASLRDALGGAPTPAPSDPAALRQLLDECVSSANAGPDWLGQRIQELLKRVSDWLAGLGLGGGPLPAGVRLTTWIVLAIPLVIALAILIRALVSARRRSAVGAKAAGGVAHTGGPVVAAAADLPDDPLRFAEELAEAGRRREAMRALYGGAARRLVETGAIRRMRTRTNAELLRDVRGAASAAAPSLATLTSLFEAAWYGHADPSDAGIAKAKASYAEVLRSAEILERPARAEETW